MYHFILNPSASSGSHKDIRLFLEEILQKESISYEIHVFPDARQTASFVQAITTAPAGMCHLVVLGGDGTLNLVLNHIMDLEHTLLSCIRMGSGNDFARNMHICKNPRKALEHLLHHPVETILDYGTITGSSSGSGSIQKRFLISSGLGYDAQICEEVSRTPLKARLNRLHLGKLVYVLIGIKQIFTRQPAAARITMDHEHVISCDHLFFCVGMIHAMEGGGVPFCPHADPADGLLDVCLVKQMPRWKLLLAILLVYAKKHFLFSSIQEYRCRTLTIETDIPQWFHIDGETPCPITHMSLSCESGLHFVQ